MRLTANQHPEAAGGISLWPDFHADPIPSARRTSSLASTPAKSMAGRLVRGTIAAEMTTRVDTRKDSIIRGKWVYAN